MNFKKIIVALIIIIIVILISIIILKSNIKKNNQNIMHEVTEEYEEFLSNLELNSINILEDRDTFFTVASCIDKYLISIFNQNGTDIYNLIDKSYLDEFSITEGNILEKTERYNELQIFNAKKIYELNENETISVYYVYGKIRDDAEELDTKRSDFYITVKLDKVNRTYSIMPKGYMFSSKLDNLVEKDKIRFTATKYRNYYDKCEIYLTVKNDSSKEIDLSHDTQLEYYQDNTIREVSNNESLKVKAGEEKKIKLSFANEAKIPQRLIIGNNIEILIINNFENEINDNTNEITVNNSNQYNSSNITNNQLVGIYFNEYINAINNNIQEAYNMMDVDYRNKKFSTIEKYKKYINNIKSIIYNLKLTSYSVDENDGYTEYICKDQYNNVYIFKETSVMQYKILLDEYTFGNGVITERYENLDKDRDKVILNIDKFFRMINLLDYESAYNLLNQNFKNKNFKTQSEFEKYINNNLFANNSVSYESYSREGSTNMYKLKITDTTGKNKEEIEFKIIMQLKEGTDFEMSFSM